MDGAATMAPRLGFKHHLRVEVAPGKGAYLFDERGVTMLKGPHIDALAGLLDGTRDLENLFEAAPDGITPEQVAAIVLRLSEAGLLAVRPPELAGAAPAVLAYWEAGGLDAAAAITAVTAGSVRVSGVGAVDPAATLAALRAAGADAHRADPLDPPRGQLSVVLCDDYLCPRLGEVDAAHRAAGVAWLLAKPVGTQLWLGPVFQPGQPGCWHCLTVRLWRHRCAENSAQRELGRSGPAPRPVAAVPPAAAAAANLIALEAAKWLAGHRHPGQRAVWTFDTFTFAGRHHEFRPYPQCATCGNPALVREQAHRPVILRSRRTASRGDGHRALAPDLVQARYRHLVSPVTGVIKEIRRDRRGPAQFNCFRSGTNPAAPVPDLDRLRAMLRQENGGKGVTTLHAEVSALCEAVERYSGTFHGDEERVRGSMRSLGEVCMHPNDFMLFDRRQYERRADWNARHGDFQQVCDPFDPEAVLDWSPVWSLTEQRHRLLPTGYLYYGVPAEPDRWYVRADSNGNAAGSSLEDAVLQGLLELVERDSVALWWYNRTRAAGVDLDAFADPWIDELRDVYDEVDRRVWVLDLTADLEIPVMAAVSSRRSGPDEIIFGFGAHLDPRTALRRALAELNQLMPALLAGRDGQQLDLDDPDAAAWWREASLANQPYLVPDPRVRPRRPSDYAYTPNRDLLRDVAVVRERVEASGLPVLVLDQTRPDVGLPVVKVLAPGLRPFWARFAPGRLFDVPVRLGRRARPARFEDLNPYPIFL